MDDWAGWARWSLRPERLSVGNEITWLYQHHNIIRRGDVLHNSFLYKLVFRQPPVIILCSMVEALQ